MITDFYSVLIIVSMDETFVADNMNLHRTTSSTSQFMSCMKMALSLPSKGQSRSLFVFGLAVVLPSGFFA